MFSSVLLDKMLVQYKDKQLKACFLILFKGCSNRFVIKGTSKQCWLSAKLVSMHRIPKDFNKDHCNRGVVLAKGVKMLMFSVSNKI